jgi:hypothetical protein
MDQPTLAPDSSRVTAIVGVTTPVTIDPLAIELSHVAVSLRCSSGTFILVFQHLFASAERLHARRQARLPAMLTKGVVLIVNIAIDGSGQARPGRMVPLAPASEPSTSSVASRRSGSTGPGMTSWPRGTRVKPKRS